MDELGIAESIDTLDERFDLDPLPPAGRPVFVLSAGWRSGSTLLQRLVSSSGDVHMWGEPYDLSRLIQRLAESLLPVDRTWPYAPVIFDGVAPPPDEWIGNAYPHPRHLMASHRAILDRLFAVPAAEAGHERWGVKDVRLTGEHAYYLRRIYPDAVFLVIHRDPYDAFSSYRTFISDPEGLRSPWWWEWPDVQVGTAADFGRVWRTLAESLLQWAPRLDATVIGYESLTAGTGLDLIEAAIGASVDPSVLEQRIAFRAELAHDPYEGADRSLSDDEVRALRAEVDPVAADLGYAGPPISAPERPHRRPGAIERRARAVLRRARAGRRDRARVAPAGGETDRAMTIRVARLERRLLRAKKRVRRLRRNADSVRRWEHIRSTIDTGSRADLIRLGFHPQGAGNPYPRVLYSRFPGMGIDPRPTDLEDVDGLAPGDVFHLHWVRAALEGSSEEQVALDGARSVVDPVRRHVERGGTFIWTIHEPLPHDPDFPEIETAMRAELADLAHGIHVLHPSTAEGAAAVYAVDREKVFVVEHPLYAGFYPDYLDRDTARATLGLPDESILLLAFGSIRPYKGADRLVRALPEIRGETGRDVRVLVSGWTPRSDYVDELRHLIATTEGAGFASGGGPPEEYVHLLFRAADLAVQPYREFHNSGVSLLALTFGCPVAVGRAPVSEDLSASGLVRVFEGDSDEDLVTTVVGAIDDGFVGPGEPDPRFVERHDPGRVSAEMAGHVLRIAGDRRG